QRMAQGHAPGRLPGVDPPHGRGIDPALGGAAESGVDASAMGRIYAWQAAWGMALGHPLVGVGLSNFYYNYFFYSPHWDGLNHAVHSTWFGVLAETGFVGLTLFVCMVAVSLRQAWCCQLAGMPPAVITAMQGVMASMVGFVISGSFLTQGFTWPIYLELALAVAAIKYVQQAATEAKSTVDDHQEATRLPAVPPKGARG
ncbi:O-antigen ligase family protein, partial [Aeromonas jandaei]